MRSRPSRATFHQQRSVDFTNRDWLWTNKTDPKWPSPLTDSLLPSIAVEAVDIAPRKFAAPVSTMTPDQTLAPIKMDKRPPKIPVPTALNVFPIWTAELIETDSHNVMTPFKSLLSVQIDIKHSVSQNPAMDDLHGSSDLLSSVGKVSLTYFISISVASPSKSLMYR